LVDLVEARLAGLRPAERRALALLALGEPLEVGVLASLTTDRARVEVERQGLVSVHGDLARLAHPIHGEVVADQLGTIHGHALLSELAEALEGRGPLDGASTLRVAVWRIRSGTIAAPAMLISAARESNRVFDHDLAARLVSEALAAGCGAAAPLPLTTAHAQSNDFQAAEDALAPCEAELAARPEAAFDFLLLRVMNLHSGLGRPGEAAAQLDRAAGWGPGPWLPRSRRCACCCCSMRAA
jgi:hypothetical protein